MALEYSLDIAYGFRRDRAVITAAVAAAPSTSTLARIEQLLVAAADDYRARRYNAAIEGYQSARSLIWGQLFPLKKFDDRIAVRPDLIKTLLSYSAEWLNVLPVEQAVDGVRPRETLEIDGPVFGLLSEATGSVATGAIADFQLSQRLRDDGNAKSADFFLDRAKTAAPDFIAKLTALDAPAAGGGADAAAQPAPRLRRALSPAAGRLAAGVADNGLEVAAVRLNPGIADAFRVAAEVAPVAVPPELTVAKRSYAFPVGDVAKTIEWSAGAAPATDDLITTLYEARKALKVLPDVLIRPDKTADVAAGLAHAWYYETALGLAESYHALGQWPQAEQWYLAAARYEYLNAEVEAPYVWSRLATLYRDWGDRLFRDDDPAAALPLYEKVLTTDGAAPATDLYTIAGLAPGADQARDVIAHLADPDAITASPAISAVIFDISAQLAKIAGGLDFWGHWAQHVPIWTFDYLQSVAINLCQLAVGAERDTISFWEKADAGALTRVQLTQNVSQSKAEQQAALRAVDAAKAETDAYRAAQAVATLRASDARANVAEYTAKSWDWTMHQALSQQLSGGEDGSGSELNALADRMMQGGYSIDGDRGTLAAAESLTAARQQREYEIDSMKRQAAELDAAAAQAGKEVAASQARAVATQAQANAAALRAANAQQLLAAFDDQRFTPDVWNALGDRMRQISDRYLVMALDIAKRMQRAYNFENDVAVAIVRPDYSSDEVHGLLASDSLLADVNSFTYDLITSTSPSPQPVKQTISLAQRYPFLFETQLRRTGRIDFQTGLDDFDAVYPGTYAGRIEHVEISVDGIVPARGISGTLTNAGISHFRTPSGGLTPGAVKHRVQNRETLVLSDFDPRVDALLDHPDPRRLRVFEGAGVASAWTLDFPKDANELDFASIVDVRLTFTYTTRFDPDLKAAVVADLAARPGAHERTRPFPLRWVFADAFFGFYGTGILEVTLDQSAFSSTERNPVLKGLSLIATTTPAARADGIVLEVTAPGKAPVTVTTLADGTVDATALAAAVGGEARGDYRIAVPPAQNPTWFAAGQPALDEIDNIALVLDYTFTPRA